MKRIPLHGKHGTGKFALVDDVDYPDLSRFRWRANRGGYAIRGDLYDPTTQHQSQVLIHRHILRARPSQTIDHKNRDPLDNRRGNLRFCTQSQNLCNRTYSRTKSRFRGVYKMRDRWQATVQVNKKKIHLGTFDTDIEAAIAYNTAAAKHYGDFATLNPVD